MRAINATFFKNRCNFFDQLLILTVFAHKFRLFIRHQNCEIVLLAGCCINWGLKFKIIRGSKFVIFTTAVQSKSAELVAHLPTSVSV